MVRMTYYATRSSYRLITTLPGGRAEFHNRNFAFPSNLLYYTYMYNISTSHCVSVHFVSLGTTNERLLLNFVKNWLSM